MEVITIVLECEERPVLSDIRSAFPKANLVGCCTSDAMAELENLKEAIANASKVAHLYNTGSGLLGFIESEIKAIQHAKEEGA